MRGKQFKKEVDNFKSKMELNTKVANLVLGILSLSSYWSIAVYSDVGKLVCTMVEGNRSHY